MALRSLSIATCTSNKMGQTLIRYNSTKGPSKNIGFIGIGAMGTPMTSHLIKCGHKLHIYDVTKAKCEPVKALGATVYDKPSQLAAKCDHVMTMLPNNDIVTSVYEQIVAEGFNECAYYTDSSTISPKVVRYVHKLISCKGAHFLDTPVSGGVIGAVNGTLTFMVGGTEEEYKTITPVLKCMGKNIVHCGGTGQGQAAKLCNNMLFAIGMLGTAETMNLGLRMGLDKKILADILNSSTGRCFSSELYNPVPGISADAPSNKAYQGGFPVDLMTKDLGLISEVATDSHSPIPLGALSHQIFRAAKSHGLGKKDFSAVYEFLKNDKNQ